MGNEASSSGGLTIFKPDQKKIDVLNSEAFQASLLALMEGKGLIVLDLSNVQFIDSSGLGKIIASLRVFRAKGGEMRICSVQPPVHVLFTMVRLAEIVGIDADAETSTQELQRQATSGSGPGA